MGAFSCSVSRSRPRGPGACQSLAARSGCSGMIGGHFRVFIVALVTIFRQNWARSQPPSYALLEGLALGGISAMFERTYPGVAMQAVGLTFGTLLVMLLAYKTGMIRATQGFKLGVDRRHRGVALLYIVEMVLGGLFQHSGPGDQRQWGRGNRFQSLCGHRCGAKSGSRFRHRGEGVALWRPGWGTEVHGVVRRVRPDGHAHLALSGNPPPARQGAPQIAKQLTRGQSIIASGPHKPFVEALVTRRSCTCTSAARGKGQPYVGHLLGVAAIVIQHGGGEDEVIAALLHDAVEDQGGLPRLDEIREKFGVRVARIVDGCTDSYEVSGEKRDWGERKRAYIEKVAHGAR